MARNGYKTITVKNKIHKKAKQYQRRHKLKSIPAAVEKALQEVTQDE